MDFLEVAFNFLSLIWDFIISLFTFLVNTISSIDDLFNFIFSVVLDIPNILLNIFNHLPDFMQMGISIALTGVVTIFVLKLIKIIRDCTI